MAQIGKTIVLHLVEYSLGLEELELIYVSSSGYELKVPKNRFPGELRPTEIMITISPLIDTE